MDAQHDTYTVNMLTSYKVRSFSNKNKAFQKLLLCTNLCARVFCSAQKGGICDAPQHITYMGLCHAQQTKTRHNCCNPDPANCRGPQKKSTLSCPVLSSPLQLVQQQRVVDDMIKYLETVGDRMRELKKRGGIPTPIPGLGPDLPRVPAPELLLRRVTTLRTAAEGVAPMEGLMESAPYGPPRVDPSLLRRIPLFSASVMLGEKMPGKGSGIGTPKRDAREKTLEIDMSSPPAVATFDARSSGGIRLGGVIASDVRGAVRLEDLRV